MGCLRICGVLVVIIGAVILAAGFIIPQVILKAVDKALKDQKTRQMICFGDDTKETDTFVSWSGANYFDPEGVPSYYDFYLFSIVNPKEHLEGAEAKIVEVGPFPFRTFAKKYAITLPNEGEEVAQWTSLTLYYLLDKDLTLSGTFEGVEKEMTVKARIPKNLQRTQAISNFNLSYLKVLSSFNEYLLMLNFAGCSAAQMGNIPKAGTPKEKGQSFPFPMNATTCTADQLKSKDPSCACCANPGTIRALRYGTYMAGKAVCSMIEDKKI